MTAQRVLMLLGVAITASSCAPAPTAQGTAAPRIAAPAATALVPIGSQRSAATDKDVRAYFDKVRAHVNRSRKYPLVAALQYREGRVVVFVCIARDGRVLQVEVRQSSGHALIDDAETSAIWSASPLPPPPPELPGDPVALLMPITYKAPP